MQDWNPQLYSRYEDERTRPARELLARVPLTDPSVVVDLGCGPGNSTELLVARYPRARVIGVDNSKAMLDSAQKRLPSVDFVAADIADWVPDVAPNLIYANAALQWVSAHEALIPRLFGALGPGGVLAVQMPDNRAEPTHRHMRALADESPYKAAIGDSGAVRTKLLRIQQYYDLLARDAAQVDVWHTVYQHPMDSAASIVEWVRGTGLKPFVDPLTDTLRAQFLASYEQRIDSEYPVRSDGKRLLAFPRMFIVAQRPA
ncbi:trans-aconitate 2-methyltransferase [Diaphorobacter sp.]|uniref:trans-aconitate 2-methyltransferase n=1 Tax=Diaphorobacter sp. TaxID=1934310 RepID=UPI0028AB114B|nr:trans-aconitate 2-methyltransferase [Diaphorobacter sp.]